MFVRFAHVLSDVLHVEIGVMGEEFAVYVFVIAEQAIDFLCDAAHFAAVVAVGVVDVFVYMAQFVEVGVFV